MTSDDAAWDWAFSTRAEDQFGQLDDDTQERIMDKLDEVVSSDWREPGDYLEPLTNSPFKKLRVGDYSK